MLLNIEIACELTFPLFIRKLNRRLDFDSHDISTSVKNIFELSTAQSNTISVYRVSNSKDICLAVAALNGGRISDVQEMFFLQIQESEIHQAGIQAVQADDKIPCMAAKNLHHNINICTQSATNLLTTICNSGRAPIRVTRRNAESIKTHLIQQSCRSFKPHRENTNGSCTECNLVYVPL
jgi:hypothetical protein